MRLPNGYGTVKKLSGKRRCPFMACEGKTGNQFVIGFTATIVAIGNKPHATRMPPHFPLQIG